MGIAIYSLGLCCLLVVSTTTLHSRSTHLALYTMIDPSLEEVHAWGYQECLPHQAAVIETAAVLAGLTESDANGDVTLSLPENGVVTSVMKLLEGIPDPVRKRAVLEAVLQKGGLH